MNPEYLREASFSDRAPENLKRIPSRLDLPQLYNLVPAIKLLKPHIWALVIRNALVGSHRAAPHNFQEIVTKLLNCLHGLFLTAPSHNIGYHIENTVLKELATTNFCLTMSENSLGIPSVKHQGSWVSIMVSFTQ